MGTFNGYELFIEFMKNPIMGIITIAALIIALLMIALLFTLFQHIAYRVKEKNRK